MVLTQDGGGRTRQTRYAGPLDDAHWQAVVRVAVRAHLVTAHLPSSSASRLATEGVALSRAFRWSSATRSPEVAKSRAWQRLPLILALGARQVRAAQVEVGVIEERAVRLGAGLHAAAAVIDFIVDETDAGDDLRQALHPDTVESFFTSERSWHEHLARARADSRTPLTDLVLDLLDDCGGQAWSLRADQADPASWSRLHRLVADLTQAELCGPFEPDGSSAVDRSQLTSVGLSQALGEIALLSPTPLPTPGEQGRGATALRERMRLVGEICWAVDDLVDLLEDDRRGHLNGLLLNEPTEQLTDLDLYRLATEAAARIAATLRVLRGGPLQQLGLQIVALWTCARDTPPAAGPHVTFRAALARREVATVTPTTIKATNFLIEASDGGLDRHAHAIRLPRLLGNRRETHNASLMVRAVVVDALLDAQAVGMSVPTELINHEIMTILEAKHPFVRGGWNYASTVPELPPDIDDLGQVLQVLARHGGEALARSALEGARMAADGQDLTGGINTWVIDPRGTSPADDDIRAYLPVMGGWGVHPEVVANFALGLIAVDETRWRLPLRHICRYLSTVQEADGSWTSKWYDGQYYGTYRAVEVLTRMGAGEAALATAESFLRARQVDGGWGADGTDPLATSLAMLALTALSDGTDPAVRAGRCRLVELQDVDGRWEGRPWIVFPTLDGPVAYARHVVTTSFCVKALCASLRSI